MREGLLKFDLRGVLAKWSAWQHRMSRADAQSADGELPVPSDSPPNHAQAAFDARASRLEREYVAGISEQMVEVRKMAEATGCYDAVEFIDRVYGGMEDPLSVSQEIRGRDVLAEMDSRRHPEPWENEYAEKLARDLKERS